MRKAITVAAAVALFTVAAVAQNKPASPPMKAEGKIGASAITVDYSAPSKRGRAIMGGLVPYGKVWRTGANAATTLQTSSNITIGDLAVPAGSYTLYTIPGEKEWTLIVNKQTGQWGTQYDPSQDLGRVKMAVKQLKDPVETFAIGVKPGSGKKGALTLTWENTEASAPIVAN